ncbi:MAG TPA: hypothetical protein VMI52_06070 [Acetobacteraceae bacterium]|nr:hypothetical protein [Acetobacteraceae bacterium]
MRHDLFSPLHLETADMAARDAVLHLAGSAARTLSIARILTESGRRVDLTGVENMIGLLCAKALDLPPELGSGVRPALRQVLTELDTLHALLQGDAPEA